MAMGSPEWIQDSLDKLEQLEQQRDEHEAQLEIAEDTVALRAHSEEIDRLDEEIRRLYAALEAVVEAEEQNEAAGQPAAPMQESLNPFQSSPGAAFDSNPLNATPSGSAAFKATASTSFSAESSFGPDAVADYGTDFGSDLSDDMSTGGKNKWLLVGAAVVAVGGLIAWGSSGGTPEPIAPAGPVDTQVIKSTAVPRDTQEPQSAVGADVSKTAPTEYKSGSKPGANRGRRGGNSARPQRRGPPQPEDNGRTIKTSKEDDPLG